jgi:hypothetical protein
MTAAPPGRVGRTYADSRAHVWANLEIVPTLPRSPAEPGYMPAKRAGGSMGKVYSSAFMCARHVRALTLPTLPILPAVQRKSWLVNTSAARSGRPVPGELPQTVDAAGRSTADRGQRPGPRAMHRLRRWCRQGVRPPPGPAGGCAGRASSAQRSSCAGRTRPRIWPLSRRRPWRTCPAGPRVNSQKARLPRERPSCGRSPTAGPTCWPRRRVPGWASTRDSRYSRTGQEPKPGSSSLRAPTRP